MLHGFRGVQNSSITCPAEARKFDPQKFEQLFMNTSRVYMLSRSIFEDISFYDCDPRMKLDICICFLENYGPFLKGKKWMKKIKQLSVELSGSDEDSDACYSKIEDCFKKLVVPQMLRKDLIDGLFGMLIKFTLYSKKIKSKGIILLMASFHWALFFFTVLTTKSKAILTSGLKCQINFGIINTPESLELAPLSMHRHGGSY